MRLWNDFARRLEDTVRREGVFDEEPWEVTRQRPCRLWLGPGACRSFGADIEFCPASNRIECIFRPSGSVRVFRLHRRIHLARPPEDGVIRIRPQQFARALTDLTCYAGEDPPPGGVGFYQK